jgi:hypothetical protein
MNQEYSFRFTPLYSLFPACSPKLVYLFLCSHWGNPIFTSVRSPLLLLAFQAPTSLADSLSFTRLAAQTTRYAQTIKKTKGRPPVEGSRESVRSLVLPTLRGFSLVQYSLYTLSTLDKQLVNKLRLLVQDNDPRRHLWIEVLGPLDSIYLSTKPHTFFIESQPHNGIIT